jgi:hypothetical protein
VMHHLCIPDACKHIGNWIGRWHLVSSSYKLALRIPGRLPFSASWRKQIRQSPAKRM